jgi:hypothetical protein
LPNLFLSKGQICSKAAKRKKDIKNNSILIVPLAQDFA